jgi:hypothetical protein
MIKRYVLGGLAFAGLLQPALASDTWTRGDLEPLIVKHAAANNVPAGLVHRIIIRESRYNPRAVGRGGALGLMQIKHGTARALGYAGPATGLLDAETNLTYGVRYLAGAYRAANGDQNRTVGYYARGYYYEAKRRGLHRNLGPVVAEETPVAVVTAAPQAQPPSIFQALFQPAQPVQTAAVVQPAIEEAMVPLPPRRDRRAAPKKAAPAPSLSAGDIPPRAGGGETVASIGDPVQRTGALPSAQTGLAGQERASAEQLRSTSAAGPKSGSVSRTKASGTKSSARGVAARAEGSPSELAAEAAEPSAPATRRARSAKPKAGSGGDRFERTASAPPDGPGNRP